MPHDRSALGTFLRSRRDRLTPSQAGIEAFPGTRRVPGLRRDELAVAAGVSPDYYSRLEQGRQANVSAEVLDALARVLRLDKVERAHLHDLAAPTARHRHTTPRTAQRPDPGLLRLMQTLDHVPVLLLGHRGEVLARNALLTEVLGNPLEPGSSFVRYMFQDPLSRERIVNWSDFASVTVATMRRETARHPHDRRLTALMDEIRATDRDVAGWWEDQTVRDYASVTKRIQHPMAGPMSFGIEIVCAPHEPDQRLIVYTTEPDSATARVLPILASWNTTSSP
ncbi:helix-turn-helix transcriptional regulator [Streptomyces sp. NPDC093970]|uniref:helix-turn-helix transcriptional regulator n=1 Tax=Streptomyces sp. NPDC093970 TaxID=3155076 RepID=UPI00343B3819